VRYLAITYAVISLDKQKRLSVLQESCKTHLRSCFVYAIFLCSCSVMLLFEMKILFEIGDIHRNYIVCTYSK